MKTALRNLALLGLILGLFQPAFAGPAQLPLKQEVSNELRAEYALAEIGSRTFELEQHLAQTKYLSHLNISEQDQKKIAELLGLLYQQGAFAITAEILKTDTDLTPLIILVEHLAQIVHVSLPHIDEQKNNTEKLEWIEKSTKTIFKAYKKLRPVIKTSFAEQVGQAVLLNDITRHLPLKEFATWGAVAHTAFGIGSLAVRFEKGMGEESFKEINKAFVKGIGLHFGYLGLVMIVNKLENFKEKMIKKEKDLAHYHERNKAIKTKEYLNYINYSGNGPGFKKIAGVQDEETLRILSFYADWLAHPVRYHGKDNGRKAIVLYGEPGNGKGTITKALADEAQTPIISINSADLNSNNGLAGKLAIAGIQASKSKNKAAIVLFDEIDLSTGDYKNEKSANGQAIQQLLTTLDGVQDHNPHTRILYVFATNYINKLDPRMLRPGRIQHKLYVGPPTEQQRIALLTQLLAKKEVAQEMILSLSRKMDQFSRVAIESVICAVYDQVSFEGRQVTEQDFINEIESLKRAEIHETKQIA